jgi:predicted MPP superfamily phosphohydrolase
MKIIILGDTHGRPFWKQIVDSQQFDKIIFLGDYFDTRDSYTGQDQLRNFLEIVAYKIENPDKVILLCGNHDFHYMPIPMSIGERYSGFQRGYSYQFKDALEGAKDVLQAAHIEGEYLFTHAGVTKTWLKDTMNLKFDDEVFLATELDDYINDVFKYSPKYFLFRGVDPYGNNVTQSPIWVRPESLMEDSVDNYKQVVGHTSVGIINPDGIYGKFFFIDALGSNEYLIIKDGIPKANKVLIR